MTEKQDYQPDEKKVNGSERIDSTGTWQRLKARIINTEAYQIFVERPKKKRSSKAVYLLFFIFSFFGYIFLTELLVPPLKFDELIATHGSYDNYTRGVRTSDKITIRHENGKKENFEVRFEYSQLQKLNSIKGELITIYYSVGIHPYFYKYKTIRAIKYKNDFIIEYTQIKYERWLRFYKAIKVIVFVCAVGALVSLFCIYLMNRKHKTIS